MVYKSVTEPAARAAAGESSADAAPSLRYASPSADVGSFSPSGRIVEPAVRSPARNGGSVDSSETARTGSSPVASSQRPIHPVATEVFGEAVCQIAMDRKCEWSGFG